VFQHPTGPPRCIYDTVMSEISKRLFNTAMPEVRHHSSMAGRPKEMDTRKIVSLPAQLAQAIEDYRFNNRVKTEAEAIRQLIEAGLKANVDNPIRGRKAAGSSPPNETEGSASHKTPARETRRQRTQRTSA
jgi:hypothetical protein